ncbi:MAG: hypothetical protein ACJAZ0_000375 [Halioglobus sp.]|jgi:hypothetical protein
MTHNDNELLSRYLDSDLAPQELDMLGQRLEQEPALKEQLQGMQRLNNDLKNTYDTPISRAVPARIVELLRRSDPRVIAFPSGQRKAGWGLAIAASIMAASGILLLQDPAPLAGDTSQSDALLAQALDTNPSRAEGWDILSDGRQLRPLLTYARSGGGWCREYLLSEPQGEWRGVACKDPQNEWKTEVLAPQAAISSSAEYRTASAIDTNSIAAFMTKNAEGIALSLDREGVLINAGW